MTTLVVRPCGPVAAAVILGLLSVPALSDATPITIIGYENDLQ